MREFRHLADTDAIPISVGCYTTYFKTRVLNALATYGIHHPALLELRGCRLLA
jgi:hypothetical protein